jgi:hypothetical protein
MLTANSSPSPSRTRIHARRISAHAVGFFAWCEARGLDEHESPRTTKLYDRTGDEITLDEVERISI